MTTRRRLLIDALASAVAIGTGLGGRLARAALPDGAVGSQVMEALSGKRPLWKRSFRPPNYETPVEAFRDVLTPNDQFFVRWHLPLIPEVDSRSWRLTIAGAGAEGEHIFTLEELKRDFEAVEVIAECQCAGNRRGYSDPHVPGVQWGPGAVGNARWRGVRLKDVLARAGMRKETVEVGFGADDRAPLDATPPFVKSIPAWKAVEDTTLIAYEMNGEPLPHWNGHPARIVVPGWVATYWMKQVTRIELLTAPAKTFWMSTAYRIPKGRFPIDDRFPTQANEASTPITEILVNSIVTSPVQGATLKAGSPLAVRGVAWDGGAGIRRVDVSLDDGRTWTVASLGDDLGRFSFRRFELTLAAPAPGPLRILARAINSRGVAQTEVLNFNAAGYHNNVMDVVTVTTV